MQQPSFFDKSYRNHFLRIDSDGTVTEFETLSSIEEIGFAEYISSTCNSVKTWWDETEKFHQVYVFSQ